MSFDRPLPPPLPPQGFLLDELGYLDEPHAAIALDLSPQTLTDYRKAGCGPDYTIVGRSILYSPANLQKWLEAGGTRAAIEGGASLTVMPRVRPQPQPQASPAAISATRRKAKLTSGAAKRAVDDRQPA